MDRKVSVGSIIGSVVVVLGILGAYAIGADGHGSDLATVSAPTNPRTLVTSGTGMATGVPDQLTFTLTVTDGATDVSTAMDSANRTMRASLRQLGRQGVRARDTKTTGLSIAPRYSYPRNADPVIAGYDVTETASVLVRRLGTAGRVLTAAVATGGNRVRVSDVALKVGDKDALMATARAAAVRDAMAKGEEYAGAADQTLGKLVSLKEVSDVAPQPVPVYERLDGLKDSSAAIARVPVRAGTQTLQVSVQVVWQAE